MNYSHYKDKIVESFGVALDGWPIRGGVSNPGSLSCYDVDTLRDALAHRACKWVKLTPEEVLARQIDNQQRTASGEQVYGPPRKQRARNVQNMGSIDSGGDDDNSDEDVV